MTGGDPTICLGARKPKVLDPIRWAPIALHGRVIKLTILDALDDLESSPALARIGRGIREFFFDGGLHVLN